MYKTRPIFARRFPFAFFLVFSLISENVITAQEKDFPEAKIKVAYLFNFLRFVEWPIEYEIDTHICVIGNKKEYHDALNSLKSQSIDSQNINVRVFNDIKDPQELFNCQIIFVTSTASHHQKFIINTLKGSKALTVGESNGFAQQGGMINFIRQGDKVRFEINLNAANEVGLRITSKILRIAERVITGDLHE